MADTDLYAGSIEELLQRWDSGGVVFTIEMGGLGPGYEQCIHICVFTLLRERSKWENETEDNKLSVAMNQVLWNDADCKKIGLSGEQAGAAKNLAYRFLKDGYRETLEKFPDRHIQVSKRFP